MDAESLIMEIENTFSSGVYKKRPIVIVKGKGCRVWDINGNEYIDCVAGIGTAILGHCNDYVINEVKNQVNKLIVCPEIFYNDVRAEFLKILSKVSPFGSKTKVFLSNSGAEAVECAIKIARKFTGKPEIIAMKKAFHGRTLGALSATWNPKYRKPFEPLVPHFKHVNFNDINSLEKAISENTAAVILETIQGEGGVNVSKDEFIKGTWELCRENDILLILDEIQTGLGRTGKLFAFEHYGIKPDVVCLGKGLGNGVPVSCTIAKAEIFESLSRGEHGSTFGGNPLVCAAAKATLEYLIENKLWKNAERVGGFMMGEFESIGSGIIREVRGKGLMIGIEVKYPAGKYVLDAMNKGILIHIAGINVIRLLPPLIITQEEASKVINTLKEVLK